MTKSKSKKFPLPKKFALTPEVWGPHYWFFLHTIAYTYPEYPTNVTKRKYYDLIQNMPLFVPDPKMGDKFAEMIEKYPISPFLDSRESMIRWVHFVHNKMNVYLGKEELSVYKALDEYYYKYLPRPVLDYKAKQRWHDIIYICFLAIIICFMYMYACK